MKNSIAKKMVSTVLIGSVAASLAACGSSSGSTTTSTAASTGETAASSATEATVTSTETSSDEPVTISLYTTIPGKDDEFQEIVNDFMAANPNITVNYIAYDSSEKQKWMTLYAGGEAPTVSIMDAIDILDNTDNMLAFDASDEVLDGIDSKYTDVFSKDGAIYGVPDAVQAMGIIYNKTTIEKATGETFDPSTIKSQSDLKALCEKIQAGGVAPLMLTGVDWSLGSHFLSQVFDGIQGDADAQAAFIDSVKSGDVDLKSDEKFNDVMDTFDIFAEYNYNKDDPLVGNTDIDGQAIASGEVAMWFMGDWGWSYISGTANADDEYGLMAVPLTDNSSDAINQQLGVFPAKGFCIDKSQNDEAQQDAGKKLINYILRDDAQKFADLLTTALPYENDSVTYDSPLVTSTQSYIASGSTYSTYAFSSLLPSDFWSENGASMQQYLSGQIDRNTLGDQIQAYWKAQQ